VFVWAASLDELLPTTALVALYPATATGHDGWLTSGLCDRPVHAGARPHGTSSRAATRRPSLRTGCIQLSKNDG